VRHGCRGAQDGRPPFSTRTLPGERDDELIADDFIYHYHGSAMLGDVRGREAFKQILEVFRAAFPNFETEVKTLVAKGDVVAAWHTHRGQHGGECARIAWQSRSQRAVLPSMSVKRTMMLPGGRSCMIRHCTT
jgi:SnoaL-like polyketide cyclase